MSFLYSSGTLYSSGALYAGATTVTAAAAVPWVAAPAGAVTAGTVTAYTGTAGPVVAWLDAPRGTVAAGSVAAFTGTAAGLVQPVHAPAGVYSSVAPPPPPTPVWPTVTTRVAFTGILSGVTVTPNTPGATLNWTDISARAIPQLGSDRGRQYELDAIEVGTMDVLLYDADEAFNPQNTMSPYFPYVVPYVPIQVTSTWNGVTRALFTGLVERWPNSWTEQGHLGWATATCVDPLVVLNQFPLRDWLFNEAYADFPDGFWPCDDDKQSLTAGDESGNGQAPLTLQTVGAGGTVAFGATGYGDGAAAVTLSPTDAWDGEQLVGQFTAQLGGNWTCECALAVSASSLSAVTFTNLGFIDYIHSEFQPSIQMGFDTSGHAVLTVNASAFGVSTVTSTQTYAYGTFAHLSCQVTFGGSPSFPETFTFVVNGATVGSVSVSGIVGGNGVVAPQRVIIGGNPGDMVDVTVSHVAVWKNVAHPRHRRRRHPDRGNFGPLRTDRPLDPLPTAHRRTDRQRSRHRHRHGSPHPTRRRHRPRRGQRRGEH